MDLQLGIQTRTKKIPAQIKNDDEHNNKNNNNNDKSLGTLPLPSRNRVSKAGRTNRRHLEKNCPYTNKHHLTSLPHPPGGPKPQTEFQKLGKQTYLESFDTVQKQAPPPSLTHQGSVQGGDRGVFDQGEGAAVQDEAARLAVAAVLLAAGHVVAVPLELFHEARLHGPGSRTCLWENEPKQQRRKKGCMCM